MDLSRKDISRIAEEVEQVVRSLHAAHLARGEGSFERFLAFFEDDVIGIGTGSDEVVYNKADLTTLLEREWGEMPTSPHYVLHSVDVRVLSAESASAQSFVDIYLGAPDGPSILARLTTVFRKVDGQWKGVHWHASTPWEIQPEGVSWPADQLEAKARKLEQEVAARTEELARANRELEVEAALERVRRVTAGMVDPSDLIDVVKQIRREVDVLYAEIVAEVGLMLEEDEENYRFWSILDVNEVPDNLDTFGLVYPKNSDQRHPLIDWLWEATGAYAVRSYDLDALWQMYASLALHNPKEGEILKAALDGGMARAWSSVSSIQSGRMYVVWVAEPPQELASVQPRMAGVLSEAQLRVEELREAHRLKREAQFESALERIRRATSQMTDPSDVKLVLGQVKQEVESLFEGKVIEIAILREDEDNIYSWNILDVADEHVDTIEGQGMPFPKDLEPPHPVLTKIYARDERFFQFKWDVENVMAAYNYAAERFPEMAVKLKPGIEAGLFDNMHSAISTLNDARFKTSWLSEPPAEIATIQPRIADELDLAFKRVRELEEAHQRAQEAQVEAALERIRGRALAMRSSDELDDVADEIRRQMGLLGQKELELAVIHIFETGTEFLESWGALPDPARGFQIVKAPMRLFPKKGIAIMEEAIAAYESDQTLHELINEGDKARDFFANMKKFAPEHYEVLSKLVPEGMTLEDGKAWWTFADFDGGSLGIVTYQPASEKSKDLLVRTAKVFDLAYRRFRDLREAEEAEREAQIEAALERVRSRSMAMQSSEELMEVAQVLFQQLIGLGLDPAVVETCGFVVFQDGTRIGDTFLTQPDGSAMAYTFSAEYGGNRATSEHYEAWRQAKPIHVVTLMGPELPDHLAYLAQSSGKPVDRFHEMAGKVMPQGSYNYSANFRHGYVAVITTEPQAEAEALYPRFARVFEQAYTRFLDLKNAEAAKREAQIEAALERVRAQAMGMRNSDELLEVVATIHRQFSGLGLECGVFWHARYHPDHYEKAMTALDGSRVSTLIILPRDFSAVPELAKWERGTEPFAVFKFDANAGCQYMQHMINKGHLLEADPNGVTPDDVRENRGLTFVQARTTSGEIGYSLWGETDPEPEAEAILTRFARVFDLAHRRFEDLQESETAAREARIDVALERVRSRAMAMHDSVELSETIGVMFDQMKDLGFTPVSTFLTLMDEDLEGMTFRMTGRDGSRALTDIRWESSSMPQFREVRDAWKRGDAILGAHYTGTGLEDFLRIIDPINNQLAGDSRLRMSDFGDGLYSCSGRHAFGTLGILSAAPVPADQQDLLIRFAKEFERVYRRFLDLEKAESQARESRIEAALERVRGMAMAMQKPEDIGATCHAMFEEIRTLCPDVLRLGIGVTVSDDKMQPWLVGKDAAGEPRIYEGRLLARGEREEVDALFDAWEEKRALWFKESLGFLEWAQTIYTGAVAQGVIPLDMKRDQYFSAFTHQTGFLYVIAYDPFGLDREEGRIINRFGGVFDLAYQRYNDLKQAEIDYQALLAEKARTEKALTDLQATQKQLIEQEKLASLGSLTAGIAHEIKNPLNFVNNFAEVSTELMEELAEAVARGDTEEAAVILEDLRDNATQIAKHGKRADSIVRSMMQHARGGASERETIQVNHFLEEYANLAWHGMRARDHGFQADVIRELDPAAGSLDVMPQELGRVVLNLLNNAFDAIKGREGAVVTVASKRTEDGVTILVSDNGPGIPEAIRQKIFEPFFTTKATGEGTGLGLSLSYDIVTKGHGGTMTVGESPDGGALFTITIPVRA